MRPTCRSMTPETHRTRSSPVPSRASVWAALRIGASGFRSSWASMARNSSLRRSASSRARSEPRRSVMSRKTSTTPTMRPRVSRIGAPLSSMGSSLPSLAISTVWLARPTMVPRRITLLTGFSTVSRVVLVDDAEHRVQGLAQRLGAPAGEGLRDRVQQGDPPLRVGHHDRVADAGERGAEALALGVQHVGGPLAGGQVARDERDDHRDQHEPEREADHRAGERGAGVGARGRLPPGEQRALELLHAVDLVADQVHHALALALEQVLPGERERPAPVGLGLEAVEPLPEHREPLGGELLQLEHVRGLRAGCRW